MALRNNVRRAATSNKKVSTAQIMNEITKLAYQFYVDRGNQHGDDMNDWLRAERIVKAKYSIL